MKDDIDVADFSNILNEQKQEKTQEIQHIEIKEEQNNNETPKQIEKVDEEKTEDKES